MVATMSEHWPWPEHLSSLTMAALADLPDGMVLADASGRVVYVNRAGAEMFGHIATGGHVSECARRHHIMRPDGTRYLSEELPLVRAALARERVVDQHCRIRKPDGTLVDVLATATPLSDGGLPAGAVLVMHDVTTRVALMRTLRLSEERFKALALATAQMVWTTDARGMVIEDSPSWRAFTGQGVSEWLGRGWLDVVHPEDRERTFSTWSASVSQGTFYQVEYRARRHDGVYRWTVARGAPLRDDDGTLREWIGCNWDIHPIKAAQEEQARISEFQRTLLGIVGHDLRNPLSSISIASGLLQRADVDSRARQLGNRVARAVERASGIIALLVDVTQSSLDGGLRLDLSSCDLAALSAEVISELDGQSAERSISLDTQGDTRGSWDCARLAQAVSNLLGNAVQHGTPGTPIVLRVDGRSEHVLLEVENHAPPIAPERLPDLFEPFKHGNSPGRTNLGLGLFIVKQVVEAHGGHIAVDSNTSRTCFRVRLPRKKGWQLMDGMSTN
jgi:PAS domain S-box-containing protein